MTGIRFEVEALFDIPTRGGLIVTGKLVEGEIENGTVLRDETTGSHVHVVAVEFATPATERTGRTSLVIDRADSAHVSEGAVLVDA